MAMPSLAEMVRTETRRATLLEVLLLCTKCKDLDELIEKLEARLNG